MSVEDRDPQFAAPQRFSVVVSRASEAAVVRCSGRLCFEGEAKILADTMQDLLRDGVDVVLDFGAVSLLDSAGIGQLVLIHMQARALDREVSIACASKFVRDLLELTNVASLFEFFDSVDLALTSRPDRVA
jgi:anti-sigma B factor antagonist